MIFVIYEDDHDAFFDDNDGEYYLGAEINTSMSSTLILMNESFLQDQTLGLSIIIMFHIILIGHLQLGKVDKRRQ